MKVIGAGFGRTGTRALKAALERLGYGPCYHMSEVIAKPHRVRQWLEIAEGATADWDAVFAGYQATTDWPAAAYWRQLAAHYPDAKVILSVRDPQRWYESMSATIFKRALAERRPLPAHRRVIRWLVARRAPDFALYPRMSRATVMDGIFGGRIDDRAHVIQVFERHIAEVKASDLVGPVAGLRRPRGMGAALRIPRMPGAGRTLSAGERPARSSTARDLSSCCA